MSVLYKRVELIQTVTLLFRQTVFLAVEVQKTIAEVALLPGTTIQSHWLILPYIMSYNR